MVRPLSSNLLVVLVVASTILGCAKNRLSLRAPECTEEPGGVPVGTPAPEIEGEDIDGVPFKLKAYRGQVVLLDFWGNW